MKLKEQEAIIHSYSFDATGKSIPPRAVAFLEDTRDARELILFARSRKIPIVPRGAGTGFAAGCVPTEDAIVATTEKMAKIIDIDTQNMVALVEPGVVTAELQKAAEEFGLMYPPDPSSLETCTIGGNIATNAGGPKAVKYGVTSDYVVGVEAVLGTGEIYSQIARVKKNVTGYRIHQLLVGSEGTLGIITKALLKLVPKPEAKATFLFAFRTLREAGEAVQEILKNLKPSVLEIMDSTSIGCVKRYRNISLPEGTEAVLLVELDGTETEVRGQEQKLLKIVQTFKAEVQRAQNDGEIESIWKVRRAISPSLLNIAPTKINEDITVPVSRLAEALEAFRNVGRKYGLPVVSFGHAGDGNIHVNIMTDKNDPLLWAKALKATKEIFMITVSLGGVLSGEHGIGTTKREFLPLQMPNQQLLIYRRLKHAFDPDNIMNPGKKL